MGTIAWNNEVRLILADVDQTVADDFLPATTEMIEELTELLSEGRSIFFVTGSPLNRLKLRVTNKIPPELRHRIIVSHCSGAEVWGFDKDGEQHDKPFYSVYDSALTEAQKTDWRKAVDQLIDEFSLETHPPEPIREFRLKYGDNPFAVILEDRGPQITLEIINGHDLSGPQLQQIRSQLPDFQEITDMRQPLQARINELLKSNDVPVTARIAGVFALDLAIEGVSKAESVKKVLSSPHVLQHIGMGQVDLTNPSHLEIWGDRFDKDKGTDWLMCRAVAPEVRAIDFRQEAPETFHAGFNIVLWNGNHQLESGTLEYLRSRKRLQY